MSTISKRSRSEVAQQTASNRNVSGWRRENGRLGVRNHVVLLPVDAAAADVAARIAGAAEGVVALPDTRALLEPGTEPDVHRRTMIGLGANPNVAAAIVIGSEEDAVRGTEIEIAHTGKPVVGFVVRDDDPAAMTDVAIVARDFLSHASALKPEEAPLSDLWISTKCELSDATSASPPVRQWAACLTSSYRTASSACLVRPLSSAARPNSWPSSPRHRRSQQSGGAPGSPAKSRQKRPERVARCIRSRPRATSPQASPRWRKRRSQVSKDRPDRPLY